MSSRTSLPRRPSSDPARAVTRWRAQLLIAAIAIGLASSAAAFTLQRTTNGAAPGTPLKWNLVQDRQNVSNGSVLYRIGTTGSADRATFSGDISEFAAIRRGFAAWNDVPGSTWRAIYDGTTSTETVTSNRINSVYFERDDAELDDSVFGLTTVFFGTDTGRIIDADMQLNDANFSWDTLGSSALGTAGRAMVENIVAHEAGHFLGLDHSFVGDASMVATTSAGVVRNLFPSNDDRAALRASYPAPLTPPLFGQISGTVTRAVGGAPVKGVQIAAIDIVEMRVRVGVATATDGTYTLGSLPPGDYWLVATPVRVAELGPFHADSADDLHAELAGVPVGTTAVPQTFRVEAGGTIANGDPVAAEVGAGTYQTDFALTANTGEPFPEPNSTAVNATPLGLAHGAIGVIARLADVDGFLFDGLTDERVEIVVFAANLRSRLSDPSFAVRRPNGTVLIQPTSTTPEADDRDPASFDASGPDFDPYVESLTLDADGQHLLRVRRAFGSFGADAFYVVAVLPRPDGDARHASADVGPSSVASTLRVTPGSLAVGSANVTAVEVVVRNRFGHPIPGSELVGGVVSVTVDAVAIAMAEAPAGSGIWTGTANASATPGSRPVVATLGTGGPTLTGSLGSTRAVDASAGTVVVTPDALFADSASRATIRVSVLDLDGEPIRDPAVAVVAVATSGTVANSGALAFDADTQAWLGTLTAPAAAGTSTVSVTAGGVALNTSATVQFDPTPNPGQGGGGGGGGGGSGDGGGCGAVPSATTQAAAVAWWLCAFALLPLLAVAGQRRAGRARQPAPCLVRP